ncbi:MAG: sialate O-acetylesterase [Ruminococcaceae bacterium]|nr:sialate O-acetylesterase [Oscillospiraceae bacterium]
MIGIRNGMVMQRNGDDVCQVLLTDVDEIRWGSFRGPAEGRIHWEKTEGGWILRGIPVGGPYCVTVNEETFTDIYVGDVWLLAGQSNMEGVGWLTEEDRVFEGEEDVRSFGMDDLWVPARGRLHRPWLAVDKVHTEALICDPGNDPENRGIGPGLYFAQKMKAATGVPQGVICCAHGGTALHQWDPALKVQGPGKSLYAAMMRRFRANGSHVRGLFWYQGCSDAMSRKHEAFTEKTKVLFENAREDFGPVPIVQVQLGNVTCGVMPNWDSDWSSVREQQRVMAAAVPMLDTVSTIGMEKDDAVHLSSASQKEIGRSAAESMCALLGLEGYLPAPVYKSHKVYPAWLQRCTIIEVEYDHVWGGLRADGVAAGFALSNTDEKALPNWVAKVSVEGNKVYLRVPRTVEQLENWYMYYGYGANPYCNIMDQHGRRIPAMGPIRLNVEREGSV